MATKKSLGLSFVHLMAHSLFQVTAVLANNAWHRNVVLITPSELPAATGTKSTSLCQGSTAAPSARLESLPSDPLFPSPGAMDWAGLEGKSRITSFQAPCNGQGYPGSFAVLLQLQFSKLGRILVTWRLNVTTANLQKKESWGGHLQSWAYRAPYLHISQQYSLQVFPPSPLGIKKSLCIPLDPSTFNAQCGIHFALIPLNSQFAWLYLACCCDYYFISLPQNSSFDPHLSAIVLCKVHSGFVSSRCSPCKEDFV